MSAAATSRSGRRVPLYCITLVREMTRSEPTCDRSEMTPSVMPSAKYGSFSAELSWSGSTAMERMRRSSGRLPSRPRATGPEPISTAVTAATESDAHAV